VAISNRDQCVGDAHQRRKSGHGDKLDMRKRPPHPTPDYTCSQQEDSDKVHLIQNYAVVQATLPGIENLGYKFWIIWVRQNT
jgi:hypothetical protein